MSAFHDDSALERLASELVRAPSVLGNEGEAARVVAAAMRKLDYDRVEIDSVGNAIGVFEGRRPGPTVLLDAHLDTVDVHPRGEWSRDPWSGEIDGTRLWGRGSSDMKGALAAMIHGIARCDRETLSGRAVVCGSVGEELVEGAALRILMERFQPTVVIIGEASDLQLVRAGRGRAELVIETLGRPSHASSPAQGINAVHRMRRVVEEIEQLEMPTHPAVGSGVMCLTDIISVPYPAHSVVPSGCRATYERRLVPGETLPGLLDEVRAACERARAPDTVVTLARSEYTSYTGRSFTQDKWFPPWALGDDHPVVVRGLAALRSIGLDPRLEAYQFCTNAAWSAGEAGVPTLGFGPSREDLAHIVDEYLELDQLHGAAAGYQSLVRALLSSTDDTTASGRGRTEIHGGA